MTKRDEGLLGVSATTFLILCLCLGPRLYCSLIVVSAIVAGWLWLFNELRAVAAWVSLRSIPGGVDQLGNQLTARGTSRRCSRDCERCLKSTSSECSESLQAKLVSHPMQDPFGIYPQA